MAVVLANGVMYDVVKVVDGIGVIVESSGCKKLIEDGYYTEVKSTAIFKIKIFNLTTLRKHGFVFKNGALVYDKNPKMSLSGRWLNKIDDIMDVYAETDTEIVVKYNGVYYQLPKSGRKILYKVVR